MVDQNKNQKYLETTSHETQGFHLDWSDRGYSERDDYLKSILESAEPFEQLAIGQNKNADVLFSNFSTVALSPEATHDCSEFVQLITDYFGEEAFDHVRDIIIAPFLNGSGTGVVVPSLKGTIFLSDTLLDPNYYQANYSERASNLLYTMAHEFGHLLHGTSESDSEALKRFSESMGWDVSNMDSALGYEGLGGDERSPYAPLDRVAVQVSKTSSKIMTADEYRSGDYQNFPYYLIGAPSNRAAVSPSESYAEATALIMFQDERALQMPHLVNAWKNHATAKGLKEGML